MKVPSTKISFPEEDRKEILKKINDVLISGQLTLGNYTREFENKFKDVVKTNYAIGVSSGTSALEIIMRALDLQDKEVIIPTNTFGATVFAALHAGAKVKLVDVSEDLCVDSEKLEESINPNTHAVVIVHIAGLISKNIGKIKKICDEKSLFLIEDAAHAHGSYLKDQAAGSFGKAAAFSFYPTKVITSGEGGMITTNDENIQKRALSFRDQGKINSSSNTHIEMGYNWRMSELHAILGLYQLQRLKEFADKRRKIAEIYDKELKDFGNLSTLNIDNDCKSNYYKYVALLRKCIDREKLKKEFKERFDISLSGEVYNIPIHLQPIFKKILNYKEGDFPVAEDLCKRHICLPIFPTITEQEAQYVIDSLRKLVE